MSQFVYTFFAAMVGLCVWAEWDSRVNWENRLVEYHESCDAAGGVVLRTISKSNVQQLNCYLGVTRVVIKGDK